MVNGALISFEGPEGQENHRSLKPFCLYLKKRFLLLQPAELKAVWTLQERSAKSFLDPDHTRMDAKTELLLYIASRQRHLVERVLPALVAGRLS